MIELYGLDINKLDFSLWEEDMKNQFSEYRLEKIARCKNEKAKKQSIAAGYLLDYVLSRHGSSEKSAVFHTNSYGKRLLAGADVNLSHSGHYVVCAYADTPVGVDIERMKKDTEKIARRFFSAREYDWLMAQENKDEAFCRLWTLKESYVKQIGTGLMMPLNQFEIKMQPEICVQDVGGEKKENCYFTEYSREDYCIAVCAGEKDFPEKIIWYDMKKVLANKLYLC